jgi:hypothetical protein
MSPRAARLQQPGRWPVEERPPTAGSAGPDGHERTGTGIARMRPSTSDGGTGPRRPSHRR